MSVFGVEYFEMIEQVNLVTIGSGNRLRFFGKRCRKIGFNSWGLFIAHNSQQTLKNFIDSLAESKYVKNPRGSIREKENGITITKRIGRFNEYVTRALLKR